MKINWSTLSVASSFYTDSEGLSWWAWANGHHCHTVEFCSCSSEPRISFTKIGSAILPWVVARAFWSKVNNSTWSRPLRIFCLNLTQSKLLHVAEMRSMISSDVISLVASERKAIRKVSIYFWFSRRIIWQTMEACNKRESCSSVN